MSINTADQAPSTPQSWIQTLKKRLAQKLVERPNYSLRSMARDMGVSAAYLSQCLNGKKNFSVDRGLQLAHILGLDEREQNELVGQIKSQMKRLPKKKREDILQNLEYSLEWQKVLEKWYHLAILDLTTTDNFVPSPHWIAQRLDINVSEVKDAVERLKSLELLEIVGDQWKKIPERFHLPTDKSHYWIRQFHKQMILKGVEVLTEKTTDVDFAKRDITGTTIAIDPKKIPQAKKLIQKFRQELAAFLASGKTTEVYQLNVQFFGLTKNEAESNTGVLQ